MFEFVIRRSTFQKNRTEKSMRFNPVRLEAAGKSGLLYFVAVLSFRHSAK